MKRLLAILMLAAFLLTSFKATALDAPADLVPAGLNVGDKFYVVFTTSTYPVATSTSISFYNSYVQGVAAASTISGVRTISSGFQVIGATAVNNQCKPANLTKPVYNVNKTLVSSRASLMYDSVSDPAQPLGISLNISQSGQVISNQGQAFTGCYPDGSPFTYTVSPFTDFTLGNSLVGVGSTTATNTDWIYAGGSQVSKNDNKSLYAISALLTVAPQAPASIPTLSEWTLLLLGLIVMATLGWYWNRERSY